MHMAPGPRRNLLHHRPTLVRCRPSVSAGPAEILPGARGSRLLDRRPPHYRCPAVPGLWTPARAILTVPAPPFFPLGSTTVEFPGARARSRRLHRGTAHLLRCRPTVHPCQALLSLWATTRTIPMQQPNVYSSHYRFSDVRGRGNLPRISWEASSQEDPVRPP